MSFGLPQGQHGLRPTTSKSLQVTLSGQEILTCISIVTCAARMYSTSSTLHRTKPEVWAYCTGRHTKDDICKSVTFSRELLKLLIKPMTDCISMLGHPFDVALYGLLCCLKHPRLSEILAVLCKEGFDLLEGKISEGRSSMIGLYAQVKSDITNASFTWHANEHSA